jgi:hypothetical protein
MCLTSNLGADLFITAGTATQQPHGSKPFGLARRFSGLAKPSPKRQLHPERSSQTCFYAPTSACSHMTKNDCGQVWSVCAADAANEAPDVKIDTAKIAVNASFFE